MGTSIVPYYYSLFFIHNDQMDKLLLLYALTMLNIVDNNL